MKLVQTLVMAGALALPTLATAAPVTGGDTRVEVTADLSALGLTPSLIGSATATSAAPLTVNFPITGGDLDPVTLGGSILHEGSGVLLTAGTTTLALENFIIDTVAQTILGDVTINGASTLSDVALFSFDLSTVTFAQLTNLADPALALTFTADAAGALTTVFGAPDLTGVQFGLAATAPTLGVVDAPAPAAFALFGLGVFGIASRRARG